MKRFFLWLLGVLLGVALFLAVAVGISWYSVGLSDLPDDSQTALEGVALEKNGWCWQVPLVGALADRVFAESNTLTTQKLGELGSAHPVFTLPDWADPAQTDLTLRDQNSGEVVFSGTMTEYADFQYTENGSYTGEMTLWRLPAGMDKQMLAEPTKKVTKNPGLEQPARPVGWYGYRFSFTLTAAPQVWLSANEIRQGDTVAITVNGLQGEEPPVLQSELGNVSFVRDGSSWVGYLGAAYNADVKKHQITVSLGKVETQVELTVTERQFGKAEALPKTEDSEEAGAEFRKKIWALYTKPARPRQWVVKWEKPVAGATEQIGYGMYQMRDGQQGTKSNSTVYATTSGAEVITPNAGTVVFAGPLLLTGNTVVIDHGCGVRSYLYGLEEITVSEGDELALNNTVGFAGDTLTWDVKIGKKSIDPAPLMQGEGGLFALK